MTAPKTKGDYNIELDANYPHRAADAHSPANENDSWTYDRFGGVPTSKPVAACQRDGFEPLKPSQHVVSLHGLSV
jgi:hypothetical protein